MRNSFDIGRRMKKQTIELCENGYIEIATTFTRFHAGCGFSGALIDILTVSTRIGNDKIKTENRLS